MGSMVVSFCGSYLGSSEVIPERNYNGAYAYLDGTPQFVMEAWPCEPCLTWDGASVCKGTLNPQRRNPLP